MTNETHPDEGAFVAAIVVKMRDEGRKWAWLADTVGVTPQTIRNWIKNPKTLPYGMALRIARALDMPLWQYVEPHSAVAS